MTEEARALLDQLCSLIADRAQVTMAINELEHHHITRENLYMQVLFREQNRINADIIKIVNIVRVRGAVR